MVRTLEELNKLVKDERQDEITKEEWEAIDTILNAIIDFIDPNGDLFNVIFDFLKFFSAWYEELTSTLETED